MPRDRRRAERALIAGSRHDDHALPHRVIQRGIEGRLGFRGRTREREAQIDHPRAGVDAVDERRGEIVGVALGIRLAPEVESAKIGRTSSVQLGQIAGADDDRLAARMPATNVAC